MDVKEMLIDEFLAFRSFHDVKQIDEFIKLIKPLISENNETNDELKYLLLVMKAAREDCISSDFAKCRKIASPIFKWLTAKKDLEYFEIIILYTVLPHAPTYKLADELAQNAIRVLKSKYAYVKKQKPIIYTIYTNMTLRLVRARYFDMKNPAKQNDELQEIEVLFSQYMKLIKAVCAEKNLYALSTVLDVRKALFEGDCEGIVSGLDKLDEAQEKEWLKTTRDEVVEYLSQLNTKLTTKLRDLLIGKRIQTRRNVIGITTIELADHIGEDEKTICEYERGGKGIRESQLYEIAEALNTDVAFLVGDNDTATAARVEDDLLVHKIQLAVRNASETDKQYILDFVRGYMKQKKILCGKG